MRRITVPLLIFGLAVCLAAIANAQVPLIVQSMGGGGSSIGDGSTAATGDILTGGFDVVNNVALTGDNGGVGATERLGGSSSPFATTAAKKIGGPSVYGGGFGTKNGTLTHANCATSAIIVNGIATDGVTTWTQTFTFGTNVTYGANCTEDATNLAAAITAGATSGLYVTATSVGCVVGLAAKPGMNSYMNMTGDAAGTCMAEVNGQDGPVRIQLASDVTAGLVTSTCLYDDYGYVTFGNCAGGLRGLEASGAQFTGGVQVTSYALFGTSVQAGTNLLTGKSILPTVSAAATDAAPPVLVVTTEEPYAATPPTTIPTNSAGANLVLAPANGVRRMGGTAVTGMCTATPCATVADNSHTITIPVQTDGVVTNCVLYFAADTVAATRHFLCNGVTPAVCGANIVTAASTVSPCSLMTVTAGNNVVSFARKSGSTSYLGLVVTTDTGTTAQNGSDGSWLAPVRVVTGANTACNTTCGAGRGCLFGQDTAALSYAIVGCADATADLCLCTAAQ